MRVLACLGWIFQCIFSCNHLRTPVNEGKCFCPDCGGGVIYQWIVLRCADCRMRRDSRYLLRQAVPAERCCPQCGSRDIHAESLDSPSFYQLHKARLIARTETGAPAQQLAWTVASVTHAAQNAMADTVSHTRAWLKSTEKPPIRALLPVTAHS